MDYIFTNANHTNPLCRITPKGLIKQFQQFNYDREKYQEMLLEASETLLDYFGFDSTVYGDAPKKNRKWLRELRNWRAGDIENEKL